MTTLKELYTTLKSLRDMNLPVDDKLLAAADALEEKIIKEEILPALSQNLEPQLTDIQRDLVLVVEYHPGEPLSVALSRKVKICEIIDAKQLTPSKPDSKPMKSEHKPRLHEPTKTIKNATKGLRVSFPDGTSVCYKMAIDTFIKTLEIIGFDRVEKLDITFAGFNVVSRHARPAELGRVWQHEYKGWYIYSITNNKRKINILKTISNMLRLNLKIEEGMPETNN